ncbi:MAG: tRNA pseudouridine(55) synthase TruB [Anaerolineae bacterium]
MRRLCGALLLDKPVGITSQGAVAVMRRASGERRIGHAGTLDPLATGLLVLCFGPATRICEYLVGHDKRYAVEARLGVQTATYDAEGEVTATYEGPLPSDEAIAAALRSLEGEQMQSPPAYSAIKVAGKPLYWHARRGQTVEVDARRVVVYSLAWQRPAVDTVTLTLHCSSGTYVRSLVHDLGVRLGCGAHVVALRRLSVGPFRIEEAVTLAEAEAAFRAGSTPPMLSIAAALPQMPRVRLDAAAVAHLTMGQQVEGPPPEGEGDHLAVNEQGEAIAVAAYVADTGLWQPRKVFAAEEGPCSPA